MDQHGLRSLRVNIGVFLGFPLDLLGFIKALTPKCMVEWLSVHVWLSIESPGLLVLSFGRWVFGI